ncbi:MAG: formylglycine-generating enzyme family protein [Verrucomicrobiae bacterium]|nr:formylglycine-generating enzyme family protein [Verrucomicrobiae bacterium]
MSTRSIIGLALVATIAFGAAQSAPAGELPPKYTETVTTKAGEKYSFEMVLIPGGSFLMGSPPDEPGRQPHEGPQRKVRLNPFYLCTTETRLDLFLGYYTEVTAGKKKAAEDQAPDSSASQTSTDVDGVTGPTVVYGDVSMGYGKDYPAIGMSWLNADYFCKWLSEKTGKKYRLPTEAEWEYAARAGTTTPWGESKNPEELAEVAWFKKNSNSQPHPVGKKKPNAWGLYDMRGNVWEWVADWYAPDAYKQTAPTEELLNPTGPKTGKVNVVRGGCYGSPPEELRSAARGYKDEGWHMNDPQMPRSKWWFPQIDVIGFRVACSPP